MFALVKILIGKPPQRRRRNSKVVKGGAATTTPTPTIPPTTDNYPSYLTPDLICLVKEYEEYEKKGIIPGVAINHRTDGEGFRLIQLYWNEKYK